MSVDAFNSVIDKKWWLEKKASYWRVVENNASSNNKEVQIGGCVSVGFSLEKIAHRAFPFFSSVKGINSVADAMVVARFEDRDYFCVMDMKSTKSDGAASQIESGRLFFNWSLKLAKQHGHHIGSDKLDYRFFGIVNLAPRNQPRKGMTRRSAEIPAPIKSDFGNYPIFYMKNHPKVHLPDLMKVVNGFYGI